MRMNNDLKFDYKDHSKDSIKLFLDSMHLITPYSTDIVQERFKLCLGCKLCAEFKPTKVLETLDFLTFEGKAVLSEYENRLADK